MAHPYSVREVARQAGVSDATVDRASTTAPVCGRALWARSPSH